MYIVVDRWHDCQRLVADDRCDVCGFRFSPLPHPHYPGNFFWTTCRHVARLLSPTALTVPSLPFDKPGCAEYMLGRGRFGNEHWITSSPQTRPTDCLHNHLYFHRCVDVMM